MSFSLPRGVKPQVDRLGDGYINCDPQTGLPLSVVMVGTPVFEHSGKLAKQRFFEKGLGFPHLSTEDCEVRIWPAIDKIAINWAYLTSKGRVWFVSHVYGFGAGIRAQLLAKGVIPRTH
jgi:hypothetical protein